ncbi:MAG TPA: SDR family oxidoreductase [Candidatus Salinicoccus stercoripullorum]|uniref:SDR family oxidoreductase n=1 Tax=Candidatus Salinicoccus stercoripullorum TaxID=2838756 RepID=A0A9D1TZ65_9STAP|nr:SDR family oxidoreductase [Candidatus Salinicoccus stercoripullorum]
MAKTIMITGAGSGLARGAAIGLAKEGHKVIASVENESQADELRNAAREAGVDMEIFKIDITDPSDREAMKDYEYDIFVANAAINEGGPIWEMPMEDIRRLYDINVFGTLETARVAAEYFVGKRQGKIIFMSSKAEKMSSAYKGLYSSSKHALGAIAKALKQEMEEFNVQVATINPGRFGTGFNDRAVEANWKWYDEDKHHTSREKLEASGNSLNNQMDPQLMIDKMVEIIPMEHHKFRVVYPESTAEDMREEEKKDWETEI